ncbi:MAG: hypothetical protein ACI85V_003111, partial [bacterium]
MLVATNLTFVASQHSVKEGSLPPFAAFAHEINVKSNSERRLCGRSYRLTRQSERQLIIDLISLSLQHKSGLWTEHVASRQCAW